MIVWVLLLLAIDHNGSRSSVGTHIAVYATQTDCARAGQFKKLQLQKKFEEVEIACTREEVMTNGRK